MTRLSDEARPSSARIQLENGCFDLDGQPLPDEAAPIGVSCGMIRLALSEVGETRALVKELVEALTPFANWARGLAQLEQPDAFTYRCIEEIPIPGYGIDERIMTKDVLADDFARVLSAFSRTRKVSDD